MPQTATDIARATLLRLPEENGHALIVRADSALYQAKQAGRNRFQVAAG